VNESQKKIEAIVSPAYFITTNKYKQYLLTKISIIMAWYKFAGLQNNGEILLSDISPAAAANTKKHGTPRGLRSPKGKMGKPAKMPNDVKVFMEKQKGQANFNRPETGNSVPDWVKDHFTKGGTPESLVAEIAKKVDNDPHHKTLLEAQALLNELGRDPNNAAIIRKLVNRKKVKQIMSAGKR
jgi:hypothetical protein